MSQAQKAAELAEMHRAASIIQRIYRGGHDRETAKTMAAARKRAHEASLAAIDNKLFSLYDDGVHCLCLHVEWKAEEGLREPADRWHAVRANPGGVQGVVVLALRAPAVVREEKRVLAEKEAKAEAERQELWRQMLAQEKRKRVDAATFIIQRAVRRSLVRKRTWRQWQNRTTVSVVDRKRVELRCVCVCVCLCSSVSLSLSLARALSLSVSSTASALRSGSCLFFCSLSISLSLSLSLVRSLALSLARAR